jgi:hypothetical protein
LEDEFSSHSHGRPAEQPVPDAAVRTQRAANLVQTNNVEPVHRRGWRSTSTAHRKLIAVVEEGKDIDKAEEKIAKAFFDELTSISR